MSLCHVSLCALPIVFASPGYTQIATSNEKGATGAYSSEVDSSFTSEGRFGPRTAIDDLRADVDRDRENVERVRLQQMKEPRVSGEAEGPPPPPAPVSSEETPETAPQ